MIPTTVVGIVDDIPRLRTNSAGAAVASFTLRSDPKVFDVDAGIWRDGQSTKLRCVAWRRMAENIAECLTVGTRVVVTGHLINRAVMVQGERVDVTDLQADEVAASLRFTRLVTDGRDTPSGTFAPRDLAWPGPEGQR